MLYYVLKHSAKGTTWGEHKYIRKEGNRYIYPEDVKKSANDNNVSDDEEIDKLLDEIENAEKDLYTTDEAISNVRERIDELEGRFKYNANTGDVSSALTDKEKILLDKLKNKLLPELEKSREEKHNKFLLDKKYNEVREKYRDTKPTEYDSIIKIDDRPATLKYNRNKEKLEDKRSQLLEQTKASAEKARIEREEKAKNEKKDTAKYMAKSAEKVEKRLAHPLEVLHDPKAVKERSRLQGIHAYKTSINRGTNKEKDYDPTKPTSLAKKRKLMRERNRYVYTIDAGPIHYRSGDPVKSNPYTPKQKVTIKKKKHLSHSALHGTYVLIKN